MKSLILILALATAASAQAVPCLEWLNNSWQPRREDTLTYKITAGGQWTVPVHMPVAGRCVGKFDSYDDRDDLAVTVTDNLGRYIRKQPQGDIEIIVLDMFGLELRNKNRSYVAAWTSGRSFGGSFDVPLGAGVWYFVISNKHSYLAPKSVTFTLGETQRVP